MSVVNLDRYVLASNVELGNTSMTTFGWTAALHGAKADALYNQVPWGRPTGDGDSVTSWTGAMDALRDPNQLHRSQSAFLHLDGRHALCVWGSITQQIAGTDRTRRRSVTHVILFDEDVFDAIDGNPHHLYAEPDSESWLSELTCVDALPQRGELAPIRLDLTPQLRARARASRDAQIVAHRDALLTRMTAEQLAQMLAASYQRMSSGGRVEFQATRGDALAEQFVRLAWLSIPLSERAQFHFITEHARSAPAAAELAVLSGDGLRSASTKSLTSAPALQEQGSTASPGRKFWGRLIASDAPVSWRKREDTTSLHIVTRDDLTRHVLEEELERIASGTLPLGARVSSIVGLIVSTTDHGLRATRVGEILGDALVPREKEDPFGAKAVWPELARLDAAFRSGVFAAIVIRLQTRKEPTAKLCAAVLCAERAVHESVPELDADLRRPPNGRVLTAALLAHRQGIEALIRAASYRAFENDDVSRLILAALGREDDALVMAELEWLETTTAASSHRAARWYLTLLGWLESHGHDGWKISSEALLGMVRRGGHADLRERLGTREWLASALDEGWTQHEQDYFAVAQPESARLLSLIDERGVDGPNSARSEAALRYLATTKKTVSALDALVPSTNASRMALLAHSAWMKGDPSVVAATSAALASHLDRDVTTAPTPNAIATVTQILKRTQGAVSEQANRLAASSLLWLARHSALKAVSPLVRDPSIGALTPESAARVADVALKMHVDARSANPDANWLFWQVLPIALRVPTDAKLLQAALTQLVPADNEARWKEVIEKTTSEHLFRGGVLHAFAANFGGDALAKLRLVLLAKVAAAPGISAPVAELTEALLRLTWENPTASLDALRIRGKHNEALLTRMILARPPWPLYVALRRILLSSSLLAKGADLTALRRISPALAHRIEPPERITHPIFLKPGLQLRREDLISNHARTDDGR